MRPAIIFLVWGRIVRSLVLAGVLVPAVTGQEARQATGVKIGEVSHDSAIVWMRVTRDADRNWKGVDLRGRGGVMVVPPELELHELEGAAPGAPGRVRFRYGLTEDLREAKATPWVPVTQQRDFSHQFRLAGLNPHTTYYYAADTAGPGGEPRHGSLRGRFRTAPLPDTDADVTFTVITGMMYADLDSRQGFHIYESMLRSDPDFLVPTGDTVYYDSENPRVMSVAQARYHWDRMYSLPRHVAFHLQVPAYWEKDDHDTYQNDCWPGISRVKMGNFTFADGQRVFLEQVPMGNRTYRRARWGKRLEVWFVEGRDFRHPNRYPPGPDKTIWGIAQKAWLKETLLSSDADWKVLISPTPIVGPDRLGKYDNHANPSFAHEGSEMRKWFSEYLPDNFFIITGDRHWQYHSVHPLTGVHEFACGPASDKHAGGASGRDEVYHRFYRLKGGFLTVSVTEDGIRFRHHDVYGNSVYEYSRQPAPE